MVTSAFLNTKIYFRMHWLYQLLHRLPKEEVSESKKLPQKRLTKLPTIAKEK